MYRSITVPTPNVADETADVISTTLSSLNMKKVIVVKLSIPPNEKINVRVFGDKKYYNNMSLSNEDKLKPYTFEFILNDYQQNYFIEVLSDTYTVMDTMFHFKDNNKEYPKFTVTKKLADLSDDNVTETASVISSENGDFNSIFEEDETHDMNDEKSDEKDDEKDKSKIDGYFDKLTNKGDKFNHTDDLTGYIPTNEEIHFIQASGTPIIETEIHDDKKDD